MHVLRLEPGQLDADRFERVSQAELRWSSRAAVERRDDVLPLQCLQEDPVGAALRGRRVLLSGAGTATDPPEKEVGLRLPPLRLFVF
jgi:hypothetical protein